MPAKRVQKHSVSNEHKAALAQGRSEGRAVRSYLEGLRAVAPRRGRPRSTETIERRLAAIDNELATADPMRQLKLVQLRRDLRAELASTDRAVDIAALQAAFVDVAKSYSARHGISYQSWREVGVPADVLSQAGINRTR